MCAGGGPRRAFSGSALAADASTACSRLAWHRWRGRAGGGGGAPGAPVYGGRAPPVLPPSGGSERDRPTWGRAKCARTAAPAVCTALCRRRTGCWCALALPRPAFFFSCLAGSRSHPPRPCPPRSGQRLGACALRVWADAPPDACRREAQRRGGTPAAGRRGRDAPRGCVPGVVRRRLLLAARRLWLVDGRAWRGAGGGARGVRRVA